SGTYVGNGVDNTQIVQLGFQPDLVIVKGDSTQYPVVRTSTMAGDASKPMGGAAALAMNLIQSLDSTGGGAFTVGFDARVNSNAQTYYYAAWKAVAGEMNVGTYAGNNTDNRNITGVGFQPEYVVTRGVAAQYTAQHPASLGIAVDASLPFANFAKAVNGI